MADVVTQGADLTAYNAWLAALPSTNDNNRHVFEFTAAGDFAPADPGNPAVSILIRAASNVAYDFTNPTNAHVAFVRAGESITFASATQMVELYGLRCENTNASPATNENAIGKSLFIDQHIKATKCRIIGGYHGAQARDAGGGTTDRFDTENCVFTGQRRIGVFTGRSSSQHNRTVVANANLDDDQFSGGWLVRDGTSCTNCVGFNNNRNDWVNTGSTLSHCASSDNTAYGTNAVTGVVAADFTNTAANIWTTASSGNLAGAGTNGSDIGLELTVANSIMITTPSEWYLEQRDRDNNNATISVSGTYVKASGSTAMSYSWNGSPFTSIGAAPTGGTFSFTTAALTSGNGTLTIRFDDEQNTTGFVNNIAIGEKFSLGPSQSNFVGADVENPQTYTGTAGFFHRYTYDTDNWREGADPMFSTTNAGSLWPVFANLFVAQFNVPIAIVGTPAGSTTLNDWVAGGTLNDRMLTYFTNSGGATGSNWLMWIGESDASQGTSEADFTSRYNTIISQMNTLSGESGVICGIAQPGTNQDNVRTWTQNIANTNSNVAGYVNMNAVFQKLHYETDQEVANVAQALFNAVRTAFFSSTLTVTVAGTNNDTHTMKFFNVTDGQEGFIESRNVTFANNVMTESFAVDVGTEILGDLPEDNPPTTGTGVRGVTT